MLEGPGSSTYDSTEVDYDNLGRVSKTYIPFTNAADALCSGTCHYTTTTYDALNRPVTVTDGGTGTITYTYTKNDVLQTAGPTRTFQKQLEYDGLGRLSSVCEVSSMGGSGNCGQTNAKTGYWTKYTYDVLGHLTGVTQNAQSGSQQTRAYTSFKDADQVLRVRLRHRKRHCHGQRQNAFGGSLHDLRFELSGYLHRR
jgi:YD repeat-containing protein